MIATIAIVALMLATSSIMFTTLNSQYDAIDISIHSSNIEASINAAKKAVETKIKTIITDEGFSSGEEFVANHKDELKNIILNATPQRPSLVEINYQQEVKQYVHGEKIKGYKAIVATLSFDSIDYQYNIAFFVENASSYIDNGVIYGKGDYIFTWISY